MNKEIMLPTVYGKMFEGFFIKNQIGKKSYYKGYEVTYYAVNIPGTKCRLWVGRIRSKKKVCADFSYGSLPCIKKHIKKYIDKLINI